MADEMVLTTQKWLNKTYDNVSNFQRVSEDGQTGWPTIYALIQGLQHELGIALQDGYPAFGDATSVAYDTQVVSKLKNGYKSNLVYLIQGAFWAKGINPGEFNGIYSANTTAAIKSLQVNAGFSNPNGILTSDWAKALFDMSAFVLLPGGDEKVRTIQQYLNLHYSSETGVLPADGIYQRGTNTALIYAVQIELGLSSVANGVWGPATRSAYASAFASGLSPNLIKLIQFALYLNMSQFIASNGLSTVPFNGQLDSTTQMLLSAFQEFMKLTPVSSKQPDSVTMYSLMVSSGSPNRSFWGVDTSIQLSQAMINSLVAWDVDYVGRYLTGTVGSGAEEVPKNLTRSEAQRIVDAKLHLIPIYQDNYPTVDYFTKSQGQKDARLAMKAAADLGLPAGTVIYFAIDMDMTDEQITSNGLPYFRGITSILNNGDVENYYVPGVYGTRNVSTRLSLEAGSVYSYVSNMSTGFSGNLGFSQPLNWSFDQFFEDASGASGVPAIDYVNVSHADEGVTALGSPVKLSWIFDTEFELLKNKYISGSVTWNGPEVTLYDNKLLKLTVQLTTNITSGPGMLQIGISGGKMEDGYEASLANAFGTEVSSKLGGQLADVAAAIDTGVLRMTFTVSGTEVNVSLVFINYKGTVDDVETSSAIILTASFHLIKLTETEASNYQEVNETIETALKVGGGVLAVFGTIALILSIGAAAGSLVAVGAAGALLITAWNSVNDDDA